MGKIRVTPYGYHVADGKITANKDECEVVRYIYTRYAEGWSYERIAKKLTDDKKPYTTEKSVWNKNMLHEFYKTTIISAPKNIRKF